MPYDLIVAGVGGQGSILLSHIMADAAIRDNPKVRVRVGETFGAAMRGGAVASHVRVGPDVYGPLVSRRSAEMIIALEPLEGLRVAVDYIGRGGIALLNTRPWYPVDVNIGNARYPSLEEIRAALERLGARAYFIDATDLAVRAGNAKAMNVVMLGAAYATRKLPVSREALLATVAERVPAKALEVNMQAFEMGHQAMERMLDSTVLSSEALSGQPGALRQGAQ